MIDSQLTLEGDVVNKYLQSKNEFEFYYLIELTKQGIKPLSRWEKPTDHTIQNYIRKHGLYVDIVPRKTFLRTTVYETIFSKSSRYMELYKKKFHNTPLKRDEASQKYEGFLFGYPSCCVNKFVKKPYAKNNISKEDQSLLFHWACKDCRFTPELIPYYKSIHDEVMYWYQNEITLYNPKNNLLSRKQLGAAFGTLLLSSGLLMGQTADTTHYIPLSDDPNNNGLTYAEEIYLGALDETSEPHACCSYANFYKTLIDSLPTSIQTDEPYRTDYRVRGVIQCLKCGKYINMGYVTIVNPLRNLSLDIPYLALHYMEKGYFTYESDSTGGFDIQSGRVDIDLLKKILSPYDNSHMLVVDGDSDNDGLTNVEEDSLWLDPNINDYDNNGVPDGAQIAEELIRLFPKLKEQPDNIHSSIKYQLMWGLENCQVCGSIHNMGYVEITNPENNRKIQVPLVALHSLAHGSFAYNGTEHQNERLDAIKLIRTLKTHTIFIDNDSDNDGLTDDEEIEFGMNINKIDSDDNGMPDTKELTTRFIEQINALPTEPRLNGPYIEYLVMDGIHLCSVCGKEVVMGIMKIYNPLINTIEPFELSNYSFHFMEHGSFEHEGLENWGLTGDRIDPVKLAEYLYDPVVGIEDNSNDGISNRFSLEQNYPNPFNPETSIKYQVSRHEMVRLKVYDVLGNEVTTLVNEQKTPGKYEVKFNGTGLPSGIYYYRLTNGTLTETKQMLLVK